MNRTNGGWKIYDPRETIWTREGSTKIIVRYFRKKFKNSPRTFFFTKIYEEKLKSFFFYEFQCILLSVPVSLLILEKLRELVSMNSVRNINLCWSKYLAEVEPRELQK